jgi:hypothetical protein
LISGPRSNIRVLNGTCRGRIEKSIRQSFDDISSCFPLDIQLSNNDGSEHPCSGLLLQLTTGYLDGISLKRYPCSKEEPLMEVALGDINHLALKTLDTYCRNQMQIEKEPLDKLAKKLGPPSLFCLKHDVSDLTSVHITNIIDAFKLWSDSPSLLNIFSGHAGLLFKAVTKLYLHDVKVNQDSIRKRINKIYEKNLVTCQRNLPKDVILKVKNMIIPANLLTLIFEAPYLHNYLIDSSFKEEIEFIENYPSKKNKLPEIEISNLSPMAVEVYEAFLSERIVTPVKNLTVKELHHLITLLDFIYLGLDEAPLSLTTAIHKVVMDQINYKQAIEWYYLYHTYGQNHKANQCFQFLVQELTTPARIQEFEDMIFDAKNLRLATRMGTDKLFSKLYADIELQDIEYPLEEAVEAFNRGLLENKQWCMASQKSIFKGLTIDEAMVYLQTPESHPAFEVGLQSKHIYAYCETHFMNQLGELFTRIKGCWKWDQKKSRFRFSSINLVNSPNQIQLHTLQSLTKISQQLMNVKEIPSTCTSTMERKPLGWLLKNLSEDLTYLDLSGSVFSKVKLLKRYSSLETLILKDCKKLKTLECLADYVPDLKELDISGVNIIITWNLENISKLKNLEILRISDTGIDDCKCLTDFFPKLKILDLRSCPNQEYLPFKFFENEDIIPFVIKK